MMLFLLPDFLFLDHFTLQPTVAWQRVYTESRLQDFAITFWNYTKAKKNIN